jgi:hypothetical protein
MTGLVPPKPEEQGMDLLLASAYVLMGLYVGFIVGLFVRRSHVERRPPEGGEPPVRPPTSLGPDDWAMWEGEFAPASTGAAQPL